MSVHSTLRHSLTKLVVTRVTWHPEGITAVRRFTIEPCPAIPKRELIRKPSSRIKNANPEEATPFIMISGPEPEPWIIVQEELPKKPHRCQSHSMALVQGWLQQLDGESEINHLYMNSELPLSFKEELYGYQKTFIK